MFVRSTKPRKDIQKLHNVIHNTAARYGCSSMGVKQRKRHNVIHNRLLLRDMDVH